MKKTFAAFCVAAVCATFADFASAQYREIPYDDAKMTATAYSFYNAWGTHAPPQNALDTRVGYGLNANDELEVHANYMWMSGDLPNWAADGAWYCVDFGEEVDFAGFKLWNFYYNYYNSVHTGCGMKDVDIYVAADNLTPPDIGATPPYFDEDPAWKPFAGDLVFAAAPAVWTGYTGQQMRTFRPARARWVGFHIKTAQNSASNIGIGKLRFFSLPLGVYLDTVDSPPNVVDISATVYNETGAACDVFVAVAPFATGDLGEDLAEWEIHGTVFGADDLTGGVATFALVGLAGNERYVARLFATNSAAFFADEPFDFMSYSDAPLVHALNAAITGADTATVRCFLEWTGNPSDVADVVCHFGIAGVGNSADPSTWDEGGAAVSPSVRQGVPPDEYEFALSGLENSTVYWYCFTATNSFGIWSKSETLTFLGRGREYETALNNGTWESESTWRQVCASPPDTPAYPHRAGDSAQVGWFGAGNFVLNLGSEVTLGKLNLGDNYCNVKIIADENGKIVFDNGADPAVLSQTVWNGPSYIIAPVELRNGLKVVNNMSHYPPDICGPITGADTAIDIAVGTFRWSPTEDTIHTAPITGQGFSTTKPPATPAGRSCSTAVRSTIHCPGAAMCIRFGSPVTAPPSYSPTGAKSPRRRHKWSRTHPLRTTP